MGDGPSIFAAIGGVAGCQQLAREFYARVAAEPTLRRLFPGKSLRCATEQFAGFLVQFFEGPESEMQARWWLSLRESHARFAIAAREREAWMKAMASTLTTFPIAEEARGALEQFFRMGSVFVTEGISGPLNHGELQQRWDEQLALDTLIRALNEGRDDDAVELAWHFGRHASVFTGVLARFLETGRERPEKFAVAAVREKKTLLAQSRFAGRTLLHFASAYGSVVVAEELLSHGADVRAEDEGGHQPLYCVANECLRDRGAELVKLLIRHGADVNAYRGATRATALHAAARRGNAGVAEALLLCGADVNRRDRKGDTPFDRAVNCKKADVAALLQRHGRMAGV